MYLSLRGKWAWAELSWKESQSWGRCEYIGFSCIKSDGISFVTFWPQGWAANCVISAEDKFIRCTITSLLRTACWRMQVCVSIRAFSSMLSNDRWLYNKEHMKSAKVYAINIIQIGLYACFIYMCVYIHTVYCEYKILNQLHFSHWDIFQEQRPFSCFCFFDFLNFQWAYKIFWNVLFWTVSSVPEVQCHWGQSDPDKLKQKANWLLSPLIWRTL